MVSDDDFKQLGRQLDSVLSKDRHALLREFRQVRKLKGDALLRRLNALKARIEKSCRQFEARRLSCPALVFPDLPISQKKDDIAALIQQHQVIILCGETGSGKTTQLPKICLQLGRGFKGQIAHTQPRRLAAISVAQRIADELKEELGKTVGYKIRFQAREHQQNLVKLMTDGILLAEIKADPYLSHYDTLILDEAHERSLNIDFLLGYLKWLLPKRPDLKLLVTSATIDPERFSKHFNDAPIINVSGRTYPVEMRYRPVAGEWGEQADQDMQQAIVDAAAELHHEQAGDILVFLSGEREIREAAEALRKHHPPGYDILPLYSRLSAKEQSQIFKPHKKARIVLATNVAETSLTVPGIRCVIDTGLARISRYSYRSKIQRLPVERISQASANQRSGRCGREAPGICIRLYAEDDYQQRNEFTEPEILRTNLASVILQMKSLKLADISHFPFLEAPAEKVIRSGVRSLHELGALDDSEQLTSIGRQLIHFPLDPQLGRMLLAGDEFQCIDEVLIIVAGLSVQDPRERPAEKAKYADEKHKVFQCDHSDFLTFLALWRAFQAKKQEVSNNQLRKYCREYFLSYVRMKEWEDIHSQLLGVVKGDLRLKLNTQAGSEDAIHQALLSGLVTRIGFKQDQSEYLGARQVKFHIHPGSALFSKKPKWIMVAEQVETTRVYGRIVAAIQAEWVEKAAAHLLKRQYYEPHWSKKSGQAMIHEQVLLFGLVLNKGRKVPLARTEPSQAREFLIRQGLVEHEMLCHALFFKNNQALLASVEYDQQKGRRVDLLVDEETLFAFYDQRLPQHITSLATLNKWLKKTGSGDLLTLTLDDISSENKQSIDPLQFPDSRLINGVVVALSYRFEPSHVEDGVTADILLPQLNQLSADGFDWLVPGLYAEKLQALIKSLPKQLRKHFVPVPSYVEQCIEQLNYGEGHLLTQLVMVLKKLTGASLSTADFDATKLPAHLRMKFRLLDEQGQLISTSHNFNTLQSTYATEAGQTFKSALNQAVLKSGLKNWQFDDIPVKQSVNHQNQELMGFPALVDEKDSVGLTLVDSKQQADKLHQAGLVRLVRLKFNKEFKQLQRKSAINASMALAYQQLEPHPRFDFKAGEDIFDDLAHQLALSLFLQQDIRTQADFEQMVEKQSVSVYAEGYALSEIVAKILLLYKEIQTLLIGWRSQGAFYNDVSGQLSGLCYHGFIRYVPVERLTAYLRYLKGIKVRLDKAGGQLHKDALKASQVQAFETKFWGAASKEINPELDNFRWLLEEFRLSLFAQQIKTSQPISEKRLEKAWETRLT